MTLTLTIAGLDMLDNGQPAELVLQRRGAVAGRSPTCDWSLPDPRNYISSRHFEVRYEGGYWLTDLSTNGTFLNGGAARMAEPRRIAQGDRFQVGHFDIVATLSGDDALPDAPSSELPAWQGWEGSAGAASSSPATGGWADASSGGWDAAPPARAASAPASSGWQATAAGETGASPPAPAGWQPVSGPSLARPEPHRQASTSAMPAGGGWAPSSRPAEAPVASAWNAATPAVDPASAWSSAAPDRPRAPSPDDIWGRLAEGNVVDWARGGFGQPAPAPRDPLGLDPAPAREALPAETPRAVQDLSQGWGAVPGAAPSAPTPAAVAPASSVPASAAAALSATSPAPSGVPTGEAFLQGAGLAATQVQPSPALLGRAGALFNRLIAGLVVMVEARARAKAQLGAEPTAFSPQGHNPIKFARTPEEALALLLGPPQPGFMPAEHAIEDAFQDLQSHQMATLRAMQGALRATLDRFSPAAIRSRAESRGVLERVIPGARDAALWQAYEREFGGVAQGSDEAFMDVFAREFRQAYNDQARRPTS